MGTWLHIMAHLPAAAGSAPLHHWAPLVWGHHWSGPLLPLRSRYQAYLVSAGTPAQADWRPLHLTGATRARGRPPGPGFRRRRATWAAAQTGPHPHPSASSAAKGKTRRIGNVGAAMAGSRGRQWRWSGPKGHSLSPPVGSLCPFGQETLPWR